MEELRYLRVDGDYLLVESSPGETYQVLIDDVLRRAVRRELPAVKPETYISPREIQLEVRAGLGIEELAKKSGAPIEYIEKFAAPVIDELAHVIQTALSVRLTLAGDRYSETIQAEFGDVITNRLQQLGFEGQTWSSKKLENGSWLVTLTVSDEKANWIFDSRKLVLSPDNDFAIKLSTQQAITDGPIQKLRPLDDKKKVPVEAPSVVPVEPKSAVTEDLGTTAEYEGVIPFGRRGNVAPASPAADQDLAVTADLLDALRQKRLAREDVTEVADVVAIESQTTVDIEIEEVVVESEPVSAEEAPQAKTSNEDSGPKEAKPTAKKGRAAVPSWNDIVFGTKTD